MSSDHHQICCNKLCPSYSQSVNISEFRKHLCSTCIKQYDKGSYCFYCQQIYDQNTDDGKAWVQCDECQKWVHIDCADYQVGKFSNQRLFKCIKCTQKNAIVKKLKVLPARGSGGGNKMTTKKNFNWNLKPQQIASDYQKIEQHLKQLK